MNNSPNSIPPMINIMGKYWEQPCPAAIQSILVDDTHCIMDMKTFDALHEYSCSQPSGVYDGKCWKRYDGIYDTEFLKAGGKPTWYLCWYGPSEKADCCSVNHRKILVV